MLEAKAMFKTLALKASTLVCLIALVCSTGAIPTLAGDDCCAEGAGGKSTCGTCKVTCEKTLENCKKKGGKHKEAKHTKVMTDCITMCRTTCDLSKNGSELAGKAAELCAEACKRCAESCEKFDDKVMKDCAAQCRKCSEACKTGDGCKATENCHKKKAS